MSRPRFLFDDRGEQLARLPTVPPDGIAVIHPARPTGPHQHHQSLLHNRSSCSVIEANPAPSYIVAHLSASGACSRTALAISSMSMMACPVPARSRIAAIHRETWTSGAPDPCAPPPISRTITHIWASSCAPHAREWASGRIARRVVRMFAPGAGASRAHSLYLMACRVLPRGAYDARATGRFSMDSPRSLALSVGVAWPASR
ncbi:hypothetical protein OH77DRAFT_718907 [Trametes cingulata]|nr:hypothetical protein OH77DRAFT_718907 [Trametes cingulata]